MSDDALTGATLAVGQAVSLWTVLCPPVRDLHAHTPGTNPGFADEVRQAELIAGSLAISVGAVMSATTKSYMPLAASSAIVASLLVAYEYTLQKRASGATLTIVHPIGSEEG